MSQTTASLDSHAAPHSATFLGHPVGLFLLFLVEMWERFSYYGMRGILVLYLTSPTGGMRGPAPGKPAGFNPGPGWSDADANNAYGWYTGLAYLTPIIGGMIADKFIGTHRSMVVGGVLIALGHMVLGLCGTEAIGNHAAGMTVFVLGLSLIVIGTGHFKPSVSVMVGQLYKQGDARRETAFGIFYMGINLGAALQTYVVGTIGERIGWHWGFAAAAVGMIFGLILYMLVRPRFLSGIGLPQDSKKARIAPLLVPIGFVVAGLVALAYHNGLLKQIDQFVSYPVVSILLAVAAIGWAAYFTAKQQPEDRGPVASIFIFMLFNAVFWLSFEQAGSSINLFTDRQTDREFTNPSWLVSFAHGASLPIGLLLAVVGVAGAVLSLRKVVSSDTSGRHGKAAAWLLPIIASLALLAVGVMKAAGNLEWLAHISPIPTTWFQSVNPWLIIIFAPVTGAMWTYLSRRHANPAQPYKIAIGLVLVGLGYLFMVAAAIQAKEPAKASMWLIAATYFVHTMGEIVLSPTGLSYVTKAAPKQHVSLLMGIWFISSFIANLGAGKVAAMVEPILEGKKKLPWHLNGEGPAGANTHADFFFLFVVTSCAAGLLIFVLGPMLKRLTGGRDT